MAYSFATGRVLFGAGVRTEIADRAGKFGSRCVLMTGAHAGRSGWLQQALDMVMDEVVLMAVPGEPSVADVAGWASAARQQRCDLVVAVGGGSVLDAGKAVAALMTNTADVFDYLEVVGRGMPLAHAPVPVIAVPTTSGTGAEVTANAVLTVPERRVKVSLRSPFMIPELAVVDPELTVSLPRAQTAVTGMDALTQVLEAFVSHAASPLTDPLCRDGLVRAARSLRRVTENGGDMEARTDMALVSLFSGMALANGKLGAVHGFAAPLGAELGAPHGAVCAALLPHVMAANIEVLRRQTQDGPGLERYNEVAVLLTGRHAARADDGVTWVRELCRDLEIPGLRLMGLEERRIPDLAVKAAHASSMRGNPVVLPAEELERILLNAL